MIVRQIILEVDKVVALNCSRHITTTAAKSTRKKLCRPLLPYSVAGRSAGMTDLTEERYRHHNRKQLLQRIQALEDASRSNGKAESQTVLPTSRVTDKLATKQPRPFDITRYPCRKIALRFAYDGEAYSGLEMQASSGSTNGEPIETVESVMWKALSDARLVDPAASLQDVGWSRCGRTDRGVSAAGQVVALWVRSRRVSQWKERRAAERVLSEREIDDTNSPSTSSRRDWYSKARRKMATFMEESHEDDADGVQGNADAEELPYVMSLNRLLPPTIQVQAWSPVDALFNARFDCQYRHYKYFFTEGAPFVRQASIYGPQPRLNVELMRLAAQRLLGEHDFRNFCKIDPSKQLDNFFRRIDGVSIDPVDPIWRSEPVSQRQIQHTHDGHDVEKMWVLNLRGTAFLYHQVRNIVAILFLVGSGLEKPEIVDELLNVQANGVYVDRVVSALVNGLNLHDDGVQTVLPGALNDLNKTSDLTQTYQQLRKRAGHTDPSDLGLSTDLSASLSPLKDLMTYDRKPVFEMALDRPLMLWECGFRSEDVEWRSGTYDGRLSDSSIRAHGLSSDSVSGPSKVNQALMHATWSAQTITAEIYRHLTLAHPTDKAHMQAGYIPASTDFCTASFPALRSALVSGVDSSANVDKHDELVRDLIPLGYGRFKTMPKYAPLRTVARQLTPSEKNEKWQSTKGHRRTARLEAARAEQE